MRVVIADDSVLIREGTARLLEEAGFEIVGKADDAKKLLRAVALDHPDVAIVDIKMPPTHTDEGLAAAVEALCERAAIPIRMGAVPPGRFPPTVEAAAYFLVAEACGKIAASAGASSVSVEVKQEEGRLLVEVTGEGAEKPGPGLETRVTGLSDRVGALNGRLRIEQLPGRGLAIHGEIPCGS